MQCAQGASFDAVVADMERPPRMPITTHWLACYVMISRARSIEGLLILRAASRQDLSRRPPAYLLAEIDRLLALERESTERLREYLEQLPAGVVPQD